MKAAILSQKGRFQVIEREKPRLKTETDILVKIKRVGVCGSDIHYFNTGRIGDQIIEYPFIVGHEAMGIVEETGNKVKNLVAGQRIAIDPSVCCMECDQCRQGRYHTCRNNLFLGCPGQLDGALQEYIVLSPSNCFPVSDQVTDNEAVITEPLSIGIYSVRRSGIQSEQKAAILGFGPIGHCIFLSLQATGIIADLVTDKIDYRKKIAQAEGAKKVLNPNASDYQTELYELAEKGYDVVFECCGRQEALRDAVHILKPGGKLVIVGIPDELEISLPIHALRRKEIDIYNIRRQLNCVEEAIELMQGKKIDISKMVTHQFSLDETQSVFEKVAGYEDGVMKAMINLQ